MGRIHNIEGKKNKMDSQRTKAFTKHARAIAVAARMGGGDPAYNATLKQCIDKAKADNMPKDNINRAIKTGLGGNDGENYETIIYEGYGPGGVAIMIEALTDNKNRTAGNVRHILDRAGGNLGTDGCVAFLFERKAAFALPKEDTTMSEDEAMEFFLEAGAEDFSAEEDYYEIIADPGDYAAIMDAAEGKNIPLQGEVTMLPLTRVALDDAQMKQMDKLIDGLDDDDDVQNVYHNLA